MIMFLKGRLRGAIELEDIATLEKLLEGGKNLSVDLAYGKTPLRHAVTKNAEKSAAHLIAAGAAVNAPDDYGWTPLHEAAYRGHVVIAAMLLKAGADPNLRTKDGANALGLAAKYDHEELADMLRPYTSDAKKFFDLPAPPQKEQAAEDDSLPPEGWTKLGAQQVARTIFQPQLGYKLTDIFDFAARERTRIVNNAETRRDTVETHGFDKMEDKTFAGEALRALQALGGTPDPASIHGGPRKTAKLGAATP